MSRLLSRRSFSVGLALSIPAALTGHRAFSQTVFPHDPYGTAMDLESAFQRLKPHYLRDLLVSAPFEAGDLVAERWAELADTPYFSSVGGVNVRAGDTVIGAYSIYLAPAGARAGQYLGRRALEDMTSEIVNVDVAGYPGEVVVYEGDELTQLPIGNVMVLGYAAGASASTHPSTENAQRLVEHLMQLFVIPA
ncbi:MAG TPA: hypothetical protein VKZ61_11230 [Thermomicrobiales bacterium]|jgi:hypothetical protein|nr:hypothetical protein [Thermomicrobiales bacterium]